MDAPEGAPDLTGLAAAVITVSDTRSAGDAPVTAGPAVADALTKAGAKVEAWVIPDGMDSVSTALAEALASGARIVLTAGGTGVHPRDVTPEATRPFLHRELPGVAELLRTSGARSTVISALSRGLAGIAAGHSPAVIVNLPGSERGAREAVEALLPLLPHVISQVDGGDH